MKHEKGWNPFMEYNGIEIVSESEERTVLKAQLNENSLNPYGMIHGGLMYTMIDCAAGITARADGQLYVTQNTYVNYLSNVKGEKEIFAEAKPVRRGSTVVVLHVTVSTADGKLLADGMVDMFHIQER
ncbi:MAG: PaaI family thioesterase [Lachnospiraceae bacterium]|nr:PaaI family thioesterase [Lachnospiraceae bacterium]